MKFFSTKKILILLLLLAALPRFWQLGKNPPSLFVDEVSNGYNAYSILKTGRDEYGNFMPLTFRAFGDYNLPLSVYTLVPTVAIFGLNEIGVRLPSALLGTLTVILTYLFVLKLSKNKILAILSAIFLAISPWHLQFSRYDHEANFMLSFSILALTIFVYSRRNFRGIILSFIILGFALNTYHGAKIWIPLFTANLLFWFRLELMRHGKKLIWLIVVLIISLLPIILDFQRSLIRGKFVGVLKEEKPVETFIHGYLSHYNPKFLFVSGDGIGRHAVTGMGQLYVFEIPLVILGLLFLIKQKNKFSAVVLSLLLLAGIPSATATPTPHALRGITFLPFWQIISACGIIYFYQSKLQRNIKLAAFLFVGALAFYNIITYFHVYYKHYPKEKALDWGDGYKEMMEYVDSVKDNYQSIAITKFYGFPYIQVLFYSKFDPALYHPQSQDKLKFDKFEFFGQTWQKTKPGKALVVTPHWQAHPTKVLKEIYSINTELRFRISEEP